MTQHDSLSLLDQLVGRRRGVLRGIRVAAFERLVPRELLNCVPGGGAARCETPEEGVIEYVCSRCCETQSDWWGVAGAGA